MEMREIFIYWRCQLRMVEVDTPSITPRSLSASSVRAILVQPLSAPDTSSPFLKILTNRIISVLWRLQTLTPVIKILSHYSHPSLRCTTFSQGCNILFDIVDRWGRLVVFKDGRLNLTSFGIGGVIGMMCLQSLLVFCCFLFVCTISPDKQFHYL